jgi:hypothetical protein
MGESFKGETDDDCCMSKHELLSFFALAAAMLAVWVDVRFPALIPEGTHRRIAHAVAALAAAQILVPALLQLLFAAADSRPVVLLGLFLLFLPALVYSFLSGIWLLRLFRGALPR